MECDWLTDKTMEAREKELAMMGEGHFSRRWLREAHEVLREERAAHEKTRKALKEERDSHRETAEIMRRARARAEEGSALIFENKLLKAQIQTISKEAGNDRFRSAVLQRMMEKYGLRTHYETAVEELLTGRKP